MPNEASIRRVMDELGYDYLVARRHVQQRDELRRRKELRGAYQGGLDAGLSPVDANSLAIEVFRLQLLETD